MGFEHLTCFGRLRPGPLRRAASISDINTQSAISCRSVLPTDLPTAAQGPGSPFDPIAQPPNPAELYFACALLPRASLLHARITSARSLSWQ